MNTAQKAVLGLGIGAIVLMGVFPPWRYTVSFPGIEGSAGSPATTINGHAFRYPRHSRHTTNTAHWSRGLCSNLSNTCG